jgi:probable rRNA maturation factor
MRTLSRTWRGKDRTTDVLSFPLRGGEAPKVLSRGRRPALGGAPPDMLGDIVISIPVARRQARAAGHSLSREIERLLVHGLVHLLGHDHEHSAHGARRMQLKERQFLKKLA